MAETWINIRIWRDSESKQVMSNGVSAVRKSLGPTGVTMRIHDVLMKPTAPRPPVAGSKPPAARPTGSTSTSSDAHTTRAARSVRKAQDSGAEEQARFERELAAKVGDRPPVQVAQAMDAWYRDTRSKHMTQHDLARLVAMVWSAHSDLSGKHAEAADKWLNARFPVKGQRSDDPVPAAQPSG
jgi:hypothetical protein